MAMMTRTPRNRTGVVPWGLLGMLALMAASERYVKRHTLDFTRPEGWNWRMSGWAARREATQADVLCLGTSRAQQAIVPQVIEERSGMRAWNLATCWGQAPAYYYLLKRALEAGARPKAVVVEYHPQCLAGDHWQMARVLARPARAGRDPGPGMDRPRRRVRRIDDARPSRPIDQGPLRDPRQPARGDAGREGRPGLAQPGLHAERPSQPRGARQDEEHGVPGRHHGVDRPGTHARLVGVSSHRRALRPSASSTWPQRVGSPSTGRSCPSAPSSRRRASGRASKPPTSGSPARSWTAIRTSWCSTPGDRAMARRSSATPRTSTARGPAR